MYCIHCGAPNDPHARRCALCHGELPLLEAPPGGVQNYLGAAIAVTVVCCLPFGIPAIIYAAQVKPRLESGNLAGAQEASRKARLWSWIGFGAGLAVVLLYLLIVAVASLAAD